MLDRSAHFTDTLRLAVAALVDVHGETFDVFHLQRPGGGNPTWSAVADAVSDSKGKKSGKVHWVMYFFPFLIVTLPNHAVSVCVWSGPCP